LLLGLRQINFRDFHIKDIWYMPYRRKMDNNYLITQEQINSILKYMFTRPYAEVVQAIALLTKLPKLDPKIKPEFVQEGDKKK
jgi:hypothetical protein